MRIFSSFFYTQSYKRNASKWDEKKKRYASIWRWRSNKKNIWSGRSFESEKYLKYFRYDRFFFEGSAPPLIDSRCWRLKKRPSRSMIYLHELLHSKKANDERFITINNSRGNYRWTNNERPKGRCISYSFEFCVSLWQLWQIVIIQIYSRIYEAFKSEMILRSKQWSSQKQTL